MLMRPEGPCAAACKSRAARWRGIRPPAGPWRGPACNTATRERHELAQGYPVPAGRPGVRALVVAWLLLMAGLASACEALPWQALAPGLWWVPAPAAETDAGNRGHSSHLLVAREGTRVWAVGSGPTPAFGARLGCTVQQALGQGVSDLVTPWAHAEVALGARGLAPRRHHAHAQVLQAMREQCPHCVQRLGQRLGEAAGDLGDDPVRLPRHLLRGAQGRLGPFDWWALPRAQGRVVTVWRHRASGLGFAPGLLWGDGPPDLRDADLEPLAQSLQRLLRLHPAPTRWVGGSGPVLDAAAVAAQAAYVQALRAAAQAAVAAGQLEGAAPPGPWPEAWTRHERHALNWQRAWRQAEDAWLRGSGR